jgi:hypothetical protein
MTCSIMEWKCPDGGYSYDVVHAQVNSFQNSVSFQFPSIGSLGGKAVRSLLIHSHQIINCRWQTWEGFHKMDHRK